MIYGYIRVSTDKQTLKNQVFEIVNFANRNKVKIDCWVMETVSGTQNFEKRKLGKVIKKTRTKRRANLYGNFPSGAKPFADYEYFEYLYAERGAGLDD